MSRLVSPLRIEEHPGGTFRLKTELLVPQGIEEVFAFFSDAHNLESITPGWLGLRILTPGPIEMGVGARIHYRFRVRGISARWDSEITAWEPPLRFVDEQRRGPFRRWVHEHTFRACDGHTIARDDVAYAVPGGRLLHDLFVREDLERLFSYRHDQLTRMFHQPR
ncbi:MAG: SRPBCC family protein [Egibacteraceae bacterium]